MKKLSLLGATFGAALRRRSALVAMVASKDPVSVSR
jgi:hypothetical protein